LFYPVNESEIVNVQKRYTICSGLIAISMLMMLCINRCSQHKDNPANFFDYNINKCQIFSFITFFILMAVGAITAISLYFSMPGQVCSGLYPQT